MLLLIGQADLNSIVIFSLLGIILFFVVKGPQYLKKIFISKPEVELKQFITTQAKLRSIEYAPSTIVTSDIDGKIISWTGNGNKMFGWRESELLGKDVNIIVPPEFRERHDAGIKRARESGQTKLMGKTLHLLGYRKDASTFPIELTIWQWEDGSNHFYTAIIRDVTIESGLRKHIDERLEMFHRAEDITDSGVWSWDILTDRVLTTPGYDKIFDTNPSESEANSKYYLKRVYYEDVGRVEKALDRAFIDKQGYTIDYRVVKRDGTLCKVRVIADVFLNEKGQLINITGIIHQLRNDNNNNINNSGAGTQQ